MLLFLLSLLQLAQSISWRLITKCTPCRTPFSTLADCVRLGGIQIYTHTDCLSGSVCPFSFTTTSHSSIANLIEQITSTTNKLTFFSTLNTHAHYKCSSPRRTSLCTTLYAAAAAAFNAHCGQDCVVLLLLIDYYQTFYMFQVVQTQTSHLVSLLLTLTLHY